MNNPLPSITPEVLASYALGELTPAAARDVEEALRASPDLRASFARIETAAGRLREGVLLEPPTESVQRAFRLVRSAEARLPWLDRAAVAVARLVFDSLASPSLAGFRGGGDAATRHLTFDSDAGEVDIQIGPPPKGSEAHRITGQVIAAGGGTPSRVLFRSGATDGGAEPASRPIDAQGRFELELTPGAWDLRIALGETQLALPRLNIG